MTFDIYQIATVFLGGGLLVTAYKLWATRRQRAAETSKTTEEADALHLSNDTRRLEAIGGANKTISDLLLEAEANVKKMRDTNSLLVAAQTDNDSLNQALGNAKAIIDYQKTERHEWTEQLKTVLSELMEAKADIKVLTERVFELEKVNTDLATAVGENTKTLSGKQPIQVELVEGA